MKQHLSIISCSVGQKFGGGAGLPGFCVESYKTKFQIWGWPGLLSGDQGRIYFHASSGYWWNPPSCCCGTEVSVPCWLSAWGPSQLLEGSYKFLSGLCHRPFHSSAAYPFTADSRSPHVQSSGAESLWFLCCQADKPLCFFFFKWLMLLV